MLRATFSKSIQSPFRGLSLLRKKSQSSTNYSCNNPSLVGRDIINPCNLTIAELKALIWTAIDLKTINHAEGYKCSHLLDDRSVVVLFAHPNARMQTTLNNAIQKLGATVTTIVDLNWESKQCTEELGRFLSHLADLVCVQCEFNSSVEKIADDASVPVLSLGCCLHSTLQVLTDLMTLQEHFGRLKGLRVGWVGPACPLLNTYLLLLPRFGVDMNFSSSPCAELGSSPRCLDGAFKYCKHHNTELKEFYTVAEVIRGAHVIVTTSHNNQTLAITEKEVDNADPEWVLLHSLPRSGTEVCDSIFYSDRSLMLNSVANMVWMAQSIFTKLMTEYIQEIPMPDFDGEHHKRTMKKNIC